MSDISEEHLSVIFYHGAYPLWAYLQEVISIDITEVCAYVAKEEPILTLGDAKLACRTVHLPHDEQLPSVFNNDKTFLLNCVNTVFEMLKAGIEKDGKRVLSAYKFILDGNHNLILIGEESMPVSSLAISVMRVE